METTSLYNVLENENIHYFNHKLYNSNGMISHYQDVTAIIVDENKTPTTVSTNTVLIQELGHYYSGAYYKTNSPFELVEKMEYKADRKSWETFFPYQKIKELMKKGLTTVTQLAEYFDVEPPYMARCVNYYYNKYNGFE